MRVLLVSLVIGVMLSGCTGNVASHEDNSNEIANLKRKVTRLESELLLNMQNDTAALSNMNSYIRKVNKSIKSLDEMSNSQFKQLIILHCLFRTSAIKDAMNRESVLLAYDKCKEQAKKQAGEGK